MMVSAPDMEPLVKFKEPPDLPSFSTIMTFSAPSSAAAIAADKPAPPAPTIMTSASFTSS